MQIDTRNTSKRKSLYKGEYLKEKRTEHRITVEIFLNIIISKKTHRRSKTT